MPSFDDRLLQVELIYGDQQLTLSQDMAITVSGSKYVDPIQNECSITIANLMRTTRDQLATHLTPFDYSQVRKHVRVSAGRVSTGLSVLYVGDIVDCQPSQPPDIILTIKSKTAQFFKNDILAQSYAIVAPLSTITGDIAKSMQLGHQFEATDRNIRNYAYTGSKALQVDNVCRAGSIDAYIDDNKLVVKNKGQSLANMSHVLSAATGMVGIPEMTEYGVRVRCLFTANVQLGGELDLVSESNPSLNGKYTIYRTGFELASRDTAFYTIIEATRYPAMFFSGILPT